MMIENENLLTTRFADEKKKTKKNKQTKNRRCLGQNKIEDQKREKKK